VKCEEDADVDGEADVDGVVVAGEDSGENGKNRVQEDDDLGDGVRGGEVPVEEAEDVDGGVSGEDEVVAVHGSTGRVVVFVFAEVRKHGKVGIAAGEDGRGEDCQRHHSSANRKHATPDFAENSHQTIALRESNDVDD